MAPALRHRFWLWCHPAGSHTRSPDQHGIAGNSTITPAEAAAYLGIPNVLFVRYEGEPQPPFQPHARSLASMEQVVWSVEGGDLDAVLALTKTMPNLRGVILDDYWAKIAAGEQVPGSSLRKLRNRLNACTPRLDVWLVLYAHELSQEDRLRPHLELCDVVTFWTWSAAELVNLEQNFARFEQIVADKRKMLGVYLWDYGAKQPMPVKAVERQCELGLRWLDEGRIKGMIFLASCICDLGLEAVEWTRRWIAANQP